MAKNTPKIKKLLFAGILSFFLFLACVALYLVTILWRTSEFKNSEKRWSENVFRSDSRYGYSPIPGKNVFHTMASGVKIPVVFDDDGIRIASKKELKLPKILFLGCSFTHGYGVKAEETFSYLAGKDLGFESLNAGVPGWGLSQILLKAQELIPKVKPDFVVVQFSKWLPERSAEFYAPFNFGKSPTPYFCSSGKGDIAINPPLFQPMIYDLPVEKYADSGLMPFSWNISMKLFPHDDLLSAVMEIKKHTGLIPPPSGKTQDLISYAYREIRRICDENNSKMLILKVYGSIRDNVPLNLSEIGCPVIDTFEPLVSILPEKDDKAWKRAYCFYDEKTQKIIDSHPNQKEHRIIADEIIKAFSSELKK